jgi:type I restriction enzyme M protein
MRDRPRSKRRTPPSRSSAPPSSRSLPQLHDCLKQIDKAVRRHEKQAVADQAKADAGKRGDRRPRRPRQLKTALEALHAEVKGRRELPSPTSFGCRNASPRQNTKTSPAFANSPTCDEIKEQDYSLNPGRYVGVVIEEDGKTEEEFVEQLVSIQNQLDELNNFGALLHANIRANTRSLVDV